MAESGELGRACDRARVGHGNRPLMAMTRPAKIVAITAATRKPGEPDEEHHADQRHAAAGRRARRSATEGARRATPGAWQAEGQVYPSNSRLLVRSSYRCDRGGAIGRDIPNLPVRDRSRMTEPIPGSAAPRPSRRSRARNRRHTVVAVVLSTVGVLLAVVAVAGFLIHLPYVIISPGSATPLDSSGRADRGCRRRIPHDGNLLFLTVQVSTRDPNVWRVVTSWLDSDRAVEERSDVVGCLSDAQNQAFNTELMDQSQNDAKLRGADPTRVQRAGRSRRRSASIEVCRERAGLRRAPDRVTRSSRSTAPTSPTSARSAPWSRHHRPGDDVDSHLRPQRDDAHHRRHRREGVEGRRFVRGRRGLDHGHDVPRGSRRRSSPPTNSRST